MVANPKNVITKSALHAAEADLRAFRHDVVILKRKGLLSQLYDGRSVKPNKYLIGQIKKLGNVIKGQAATPKVNRAKAKYYKEKGYTVKNNRVVVPTSGIEKVYSSHGDFRIRYDGANGSITKIDLGLPRADVVEWGIRLRENKFKLKKDEVLTFQMFGHNIHNTGGFTQDGLDTPKKYRKTAQEKMADYLEYYPSYNQSMADNDPAANEAWIDGIVILKIKRNSQGDVPRPQPDFKMNELDAEKRKTFMEKRSLARRAREGRMDAAELNELMDDRAATDRKRRATMTPQQKENYKAAAKKRAAASYAKRKAK